MPSRDSLDGLIVVDKPPRLTSAQVVDRIKIRLGVKRAGHTGTLDPLATGVLPVCLGAACRLAEYLIADDKAYRATVTLGATSNTDDADGQIVETAGAAPVALADVEAAARRFVGPSRQLPPPYSAVKVGGRRLHQLARAGAAIDVPPRDVTIHRLEIVSLTWPSLVIDVRCSKGTYIRSLAADLGAALGCGGYVQSLCRTGSGRYTLDQAIPFDAVDRERARAELIPMAAMTGLPSAAVPAELERLVDNAVPLSETALGTPLTASPFQLVSTAGQLLAIARLEAGQVRYDRVFKRSA